MSAFAGDSGQLIGAPAVDGRGQLTLDDRNAVPFEACSRVGIPGDITLHRGITMRALLRSASILAVLSACESGPTAFTQTSGLPGATYTLERIGASPIPAVADQGEYGSITTLRARLEFGEDSVRLTRTERWIERDMQGRIVRTRMVERDEMYSYSLRGSTIIIGQPCPPDPAALCAYSETGEVRFGALWMQVWYSGKPWMYRQA